jgi:oligopeptidase B
MGIMRYKRQVLLYLLLALGFTVRAASCEGQVEARPPVAKIEPQLDTLHGQEKVDNYFWLRERDNPEVIDYLKEENAYTSAVMRHTEGLQEKLYNEMVARIKETDMSVPVKRDDYYYYSRTEEGKQYKIYCRKQGSLEGREEILLDVNQLAQGKEYMDLGIYEVSPNHRLLAYAVDTTGSERYTLRVKDLETGGLYPDQSRRSLAAVQGVPSHAGR